jgi:hypothetical protein
MNIELCIKMNEYTIHPSSFYCIAFDDDHVAGGMLGNSRESVHEEIGGKSLWQCEL